MMQLALDMGATLSELNERMTSQEFTLWIAHHNNQPRGVERDNYHHAMMLAMYANAHAAKGKTFEVQDFMYENQESKIERQNKQFMATMRALSIPKVK